MAKHIPGLKQEENPKDSKDSKNSKDSRNSSGDGQPDKKPKVEISPDDIDVGDDIDVDVEETDDGKIVLSEEDFKKLDSDRKNYREGLLSVKDKLKEYKSKDKSEEGDDDKDDDKGDDKGESKFVTREEFNKSLEKEAIAEATKSNFVEENWDDIMKYYTSRYGNDSVKSILRNIEDAVFLYEKRSGNKRPEEDTDTSGRRFLSREPGFSSGDHSGGSSKKKSSKKDSGGRKVLKGGNSSKDWYPEEE